MKVDIVKVGSLMCNCYILDIDNFVLVIDPGDEYEKIKNKPDVILSKEKPKGSKSCIWLQELEDDE